MKGHRHMSLDPQALAQAYREHVAHPPIAPGPGAPLEIHEAYGRDLLNWTRYRDNLYAVLAEELVREATAPDFSNVKF